MVKVKGLNCSGSCSLFLSHFAPIIFFLSQFHVPNRLQTLRWDKSFDRPDGQGHTPPSPSPDITFRRRSITMRTRIASFHSIPCSTELKSKTEPSPSEQLFWWYHWWRLISWFSFFISFALKRNLSTLGVGFAHIIIRPNRRQSCQQQQEQTFDNT